MNSFSFPSRIALNHSSLPLLHRIVIFSISFFQNSSFFTFNSSFVVSCLISSIPNLLRRVLKDLISLNLRLRVSFISVSDRFCH